jgi:molybdenum cofactor cytidylyltransferase
MIAALVLAAGASSRMGRPKALLTDAEGRAFAVRLVETFASAGVDDIVVVTGTQHSDVERAVRDAAVRARCVRNPAPERGQLSSLLVGLDAVVQPALEAVLANPVDVPLVAARTVRSVIEAWRSARPPIVRPAIGALHGHPVLFDATVFEELRRASIDTGAKSVVRGHERDLVNVEVDDQWCLFDVDTPADYEVLLRRPQQPRG